MHVWKRLSEVRYNPYREKIVPITCYILYQENNIKTFFSIFMTDSGQT